MLTEVLTNVLWVCATISSIAVTLSLVKATHDYLRGKLFASSPPVLLSTSSVSATTSGPSASLIWKQDEPAPAPAPLAIAPSPAPKPPAESVFPPLTNIPAQPAKVPDDFILECGGCHKRIETPPTSVKSVGGKFEKRYRCEHCGATVAVRP